MIEYQKENNLSSDEFIELLVASTLGERRPVNDVERIESMLRNASIIVTGRNGSRLVGVARSVSDFVYCTYLSDLAVHIDFQKQGIGRELIRQTKLLAPKAKLILLSAPKAVEYYPRIRMKRHEHCYYIDSVDELV
jgi:ribosomal protein S18 acetylase RimI-like enzyme